MRFRAVLVDDEKHALDRLERMLAVHRGVIEIVARADDGEGAVAVINELTPDVVFLDVQMPELNGFEVLQRLDYMPWVIFSTAYDQYALRAFDVNSVDYLLKPVDPKRLELAVHKLRGLEERGAAELEDRLRRVLGSLENRYRSRIRVKIGDRIKLIPVNDVAYLLAADKMVEVHTQSASYLTSESLSRLEAELPPEDFVRVHRSAIVNVNFVDEITRTFAGAYAIRIKGPGGTLVPVSRRYKSRLELT